MNNLLVKYNPNSKIILTGYIQSNQSVASYVWSSSTLSSMNISLAKVVATPIHSIVGYGSYTIQLSISSNSLIPGFFYVFRLTASYDNNSAYSEIIIFMNTAPINGLITVSPKTGYSFNTSFDIITSNWIDDSSDYPLNYVFSYYSGSSSSSSLNLIKPFNSIPYTSSFLGQGLLEYNYNVTIITVVSDSYNSSNSAITNTQVKPTIIVNTRLKTLLNSAISTYNPTIVIQIVNSVSSIINNINCSLATAVICANYNRQHCNSIANTCGSCLLGYVGSSISGVCSLLSTAVSIGFECKVDNDCASSYCFNNQCTYQQKICFNDCSFQGTCNKYNLNGRNISNCFDNDKTCEVKCNCFNGYFGSDCSLSFNQYQQNLITRELMCSTLYDTLVIQDITNDIAIFRANSVSNLLIDMTQITDAAYYNCTYVIMKTISQNPFICSQDDTLKSMIDSLSSIIQGKNISNSLFGNQITQTLIQLLINSQLNQAINEISNNIITNNIRISNQVLQSNQIMQSNQMTILNIPQTLFESINQINKISVLLPFISISQIIGISLIQYNSMINFNDISSSLTIQTTNYSSNIETTFHRRLSDSTSVNNTSFQVVLPNFHIQSFNDINQTIYYLKECILYNKPYNITIDCLSTSLSTYVLYCPGNETRLYNISCPTHHFEPICQSSHSILCKRISFNSYQTICDCTKLYESKYGTISVSEQIVIKDFIANWKQIIKINNHTIQHNLVITIITGSLIFITFIGMIIFWKIDKYELKLKVINLNRNSIRFSIDYFFNSLLPIEFTDQYWYHKLKSKTLSEHLYICVFMKQFNRLEYRLISWLRISLKILNFLFIDTILAVS